MACIKYLKSDLVDLYSVHEYISIYISYDIASLDPTQLSTQKSLTSKQSNLNHELIQITYSTNEKLLLVELLPKFNIILIIHKIKLKMKYCF